MRRPAGSLIAMFAALACAGLGACDGSSGDAQPTPADLALATGALDQQLNASGEAMRRVLASADADKRIFPWELAIAGMGARRRWIGGSTTAVSSASAGSRDCRAISF